MSTFTPAEILRQHRPLLLTMEAIGWFHMAGKARIEFLKHHGGDKIKYNERKWHDLETPPFPWDTLLEWVKRLYSPHNQAWPKSFKEFTEKHAEKNGKGLLGLLQAAHGIVSGVEKNLPGKTAQYLRQTLPHMWLSSPWGYPKRNLLADPPEILTPQGWRQLVSEIQRVLEEAQELGTGNSNDVHAWQNWRERAIGPESFIRRAFLSTLAETRLPNNDVTLWDQSYVAAALFKSAVASALLQGKSAFPWNDNGIKGKVRWRLLTVAIGTDHYEARAVKIGDWTGAQGALEAFFHRVSTLLEVDLAVGSLLYQDSTVAIFSFPCERFDEEEQERQRRGDPNFRYDEDHFAPWLERWEDWLQDQIDRFAQDLDLETPPHIRLSGPTRSLVPIVQEGKKARQTVAIPIHRKWDIRWTTPSEARGHVCPVCHVRLNGDPTSKTRPCRVCRDRRHHRRDDWLWGRLGYDTIWFEEVADANGRLALLTLSLDIGPWLSGERVDSLRAQAIPEWVRFNPVINGASNPIDARTPYESLLSYIRGKLSSFVRNDPVLKNLQAGYSSESDWPSFFQKIVEDRADAPTWNNLNSDERAAWLTHQLFRKLPSPGRVYRFWREAENFFHDLLREFRQIAARSDNPWRVRRLLLVPQGNRRWKDLMLYDGHWRNVQFSMVYVQNLRGFVTASNLARLFRPEENPQSTLRGESISVEEEDCWGKRHDITVAEVREIRSPHYHLSIYYPVIPVEISPIRFRVVVPLEVASECVDLAIDWWKERFVRVWERLPLRVGIVAFPRTVPYQAIVEAARNIEAVLEAKEEWWQVERVEKRADTVALYLRCGERQLLWGVPVTMPDGRSDVFYPYVEVQDRDLRHPRDFRHPDGHIFRHVADLHPGDSVKVHPATLITLFMNSSSARFAVPEYPHLFDEWEAMRAVWEHLRRVSPSQTALQRLYRDLQHLERDWRGPLGEPMVSEDLRRETYRALLAHHLDVKGSSLEYLVQAASNGLLAWTIEWHLSVLKESL